jgi:putative SOS response-associated peptidase YedK
MIVTEANEFAGRVHDRMPVFLAGDSFEAWLDGSAGVELLHPAPENLLHVCAREQGLAAGDVLPFIP